MELGLSGRTAIVCGASQGIGLAIAEALAAEGANVAMFARRRDVLEREAERIGGLAVQGDVRDPRALQVLVDRTLEAFGGIDVLVNNSGGPPRGPARGLTAEEVDDAVQLLLVSAITLTELCLPHLERSGRGRVINVESSTVREPTDDLALSNVVRPGRRRLGEVARAGGRPGGDHDQHGLPRSNRDRAAARGVPVARADRPDPAEADRRAARARGRRLLPRLRPGVLRHGRGRPGRRGTHALPLVGTRLSFAGAAAHHSRPARGGRPRPPRAPRRHRAARAERQLPLPAQPRQGRRPAPHDRGREARHARRRRDLLRRRARPPRDDLRAALPRLLRRREPRLGGCAQPHGDLRHGAAPLEPARDGPVAGDRGRGRAARGRLRRRRESGGRARRGRPARRRPRRRRSSRRT